ncbi:DUF4297 family anti-phage-associated protein [Aquirhabdus parva]|uniref:DUF4297 domain-containing protein n=1 Tax=Aquirhabdus parva TaxID=2283318 RepID=A0A345P7L7_9GAMM|nr:DUF4297 family anti-phage-associated protein [Aquirhabdus parva]AXI03276.1 hypothetical protein HYN46_10755 [Aquirhabdus parva]
MANRSAHATIKGYFYQFDKTILEILEATSLVAKVVIEGIEDIDINDGHAVSLIQCKYYEGTEYVHSVIKDAVIHMLRHFKAANCPASQTFRYCIYGHYKEGQDKLPTSLDLIFLKKHFLSYTEKSVRHEVHNELGVSDAELILFLNLLKIDLLAPEYNEQQRLVHASLKRCLPHSEVADTEAFYYPRAINAIQTLAIQADVSKRTITKGDFISLVDQKEIVFSRWLLERFGKEHYAKSIKRKYFTFHGINIPKISRVFIIDISMDFKLSEAMTLLREIGERFSHKERSRTPDEDRFCPYVLLHGIEAIDMAKLKNEMYRQGVLFQDGYPFLGADFYQDQLAILPSKRFLIKIKFIPSVDHLVTCFNGIHGSSIEFFDFFKTVPIKSKFRPAGAAYNEIQIPYTYFINEIFRS